MLIFKQLGVVSYAPSLPIQCLSIKDSVNKHNSTMIHEVYNDLSVKAVNSTFQSNLVSRVEANCKLDMATVFFGAVFGGDLAPRVMSGIIAFSIFGNIVVMTFTASRGIQGESLQSHW